MKSSISNRVPFSHSILLPSPEINYKILVCNLKKNGETISVEISIVTRIRGGRNSVPYVELTVRSVKGGKLRMEGR